MSVVTQPSSNDAYAAFTALAVQLADAARLQIMPHFRSAIQVDAKSDQTPVTEADRATERTMRAMINQAFPDHGILGEEYGDENIDAEFVWVLDPIDGTTSFVTGKPLFGTLIALCHNKIPVVGIIDAPALNERWVGVHAKPTTLNGVPVQTRTCNQLDGAWLYATTPDMFNGDNQAAFNRLSAATWRTVYGGDCYSYGLLASGYVDLICEASLGTYDFCALAPVVQGAGGVLSDWQGKPVTMDTDGRVVAAGDATAHGLAIMELAHA